MFVNLAMDWLCLLHVWMVQFIYYLLSPIGCQCKAYTYLCDNTVDWLICNYVDYVYFTGHYEFASNPGWAMKEYELMFAVFYYLLLNA